EARIHLNNLPAAASDINIIRKRAGLANTTADTKEELLVAVLKERAAEFFAEWGHRFFDLKRTGRLASVLSTMKPNWASHHALLPLPEAEIRSNPKLLQNTGY